MVNTWSFLSSVAVFSAAFSGAPPSSRLKNSTVTPVDAAAVVYLLESGGNALVHLHKREGQRPGQRGRLADAPCIALRMGPGRRAQGGQGGGALEQAAAVQKGEGAGRWLVHGGVPVCVPKIGQNVSRSIDLYVSVRYSG
jgi:hypothetical protein